MSATTSELKPVLRTLGIASKPSASEEYCTGTYKGVTVIIAVTDVGLAAAQTATEALFARYGTTIDHLFVVGIVGAFELCLKIGEVVVPEGVIDQRDGITRQPVNLSVSEPSGVIYSCDQHNYDDAHVAVLNSNNVAGLDMGSGAVAAVCERHDCPVTIVKAVSDKVDLLAEPHDVFQLTGLPGCREAIGFALRRPQRIAYLIALALGAKKAIAASSAELLRNIESLLQQPRQIENAVDADALRNARQDSGLLARSSEG